MWRGFINKFTNVLFDFVNQLAGVEFGNWDAIGAVYIKFGEESVGVFPDKLNLVDVYEERTMAANDVIVVAELFDSFQGVAKAEFYELSRFVVKYVDIVSCGLNRDYFFGADN